MAPSRLRIFHWPSTRYQLTLRASIPFSLFSSIHLGPFPIQTFNTTVSTLPPSLKPPKTAPAHFEPILSHCHDPTNESKVTMSAGPLTSNQVNYLIWRYVVADLLSSPCLSRAPHGETFSSLTREPYKIPSRIW